MVMIFSKTDEIKNAGHVIVKWTTKIYQEKIRRKGLVNMPQNSQLGGKYVPQISVPNDPRTKKR